MNGTFNVLLNITVAVVATAATAAAFYGANKATRLKAATDNRAVDAAAYQRATDIYESTIHALRDEIARLTEDVRAARQEIATVSGEVIQLRDANAHLIRELMQLRSAEHDELTVLRVRDEEHRNLYDHPRETPLPPRSSPEDPDEHT